MPAINRPDSEAAESSHGSMDSTMGKKSAIDIVRCITWNGSDHVSGICEVNIKYKRITKISTVTRGVNSRIIASR